MNQALVVGGGLSGLCAATALRQRGFRVRVVEREPKVGGLRRSLCLEGGRTFDFGTHFIAPGGTPLNDALFSPELPSHRIPRLLAGSYYRGVLNEGSPCLDLGALPREMHDRIVAEMLCSEYSDQRENLSEFFRKNFSETLEREVVAPVLGKFLPGELSDLECGAARPFLHPRFIALDQTAIARLKSVPEYDRLFAWNRPMGETAVYYPKAGGIGAYTEDLASRLGDQGVEISTGMTVDALETMDGRVVSAALSTGERIDCDLLVWTLPSPFLLRLLGKSSAQVKPTLLPTTLLHLEIDAPFETDLHYLYCYDADRHLPADLRLFRTTLYPNFRQDGRNLCTLELFGDGTAHADLAERAHQELMHLGVSPRGSRVVFAHPPMVFSGFPLWSRELMAGIREDVKTVEESFMNVRLLAKARGSAFLMAEIVAECIEVLR